MCNSIFVSLHVQSTNTSRSYSAKFPGGRIRGRKRRKTEIKKTTAAISEKEPTYCGSVDFIQTIMPLILISNRLLDSQQTNGLITDRDKTRKSGKA